MSQSKVRFSLFCIAGLAGLAVMAQWPSDKSGEEPYIADGILKFQMIEPGGKAPEERSFGIAVARDREGSVYRSQERPQGKLVTLWVKQTGLLYSIDYAQKTVEVLDRVDSFPGDASAKAAEGSSRGLKNRWRVCPAFRFRCSEGGMGNARRPGNGATRRNPLDCCCPRIRSFPCPERHCVKRWKSQVSGAEWNHMRPGSRSRAISA